MKYTLVVGLIVVFFSGFSQTDSIPDSKGDISQEKFESILEEHGTEHKFNDLSIKVLVLKNQPEFDKFAFSLNGKIGLFADEIFSGLGSRFEYWINESNGFELRTQHLFSYSRARGLNIINFKYRLMHNSNDLKDLDIVIGTGGTIKNRRSSGSSMGSRKTSYKNTRFVLKVPADHKIQKGVVVEGTTVIQPNMVGDNDFYIIGAGYEFIKRRLFSLTTTAFPNMVVYKKYESSWYLIPLYGFSTTKISEDENPKFSSVGIKLGFTRKSYKMNFLYNETPLKSHLFQRLEIGFFPTYFRSRSVENLFAFQYTIGWGR